MNTLYAWEIINRHRVAEIEKACTTARLYNSIVGTRKQESTFLAQTKAASIHWQRLKKRIGRRA